MREIIQDLVDAEAQASRIVQAAREEADRLVAEAQKRAQERVGQARAEARVQAEKIIQAAVEEAQQLKRQRLAQAEVEIRERVRLDAATRTAIARAVVRAVCGQPGDPRPTEREHAGG